MKHWVWILLFLPLSLRATPPSQIGALEICLCLHHDEISLADESYTIYWQLGFNAPQLKPSELSASDTKSLKKALAHVLSKEPLPLMLTDSHPAESLKPDTYPVKIHTQIATHTSVSLDLQIAGHEVTLNKAIFNNQPCLTPGTYTTDYSLYRSRLSLDPQFPLILLYLVSPNSEKPLPVELTSYLLEKGALNPLTP